MNRVCGFLRRLWYVETSVRACSFAPIDLPAMDVEVSCTCIVGVSVVLLNYDGSMVGVMDEKGVQIRLKLDSNSKAVGIRVASTEPEITINSLCSGGINALSAEIPASLLSGAALETAYMARWRVLLRGVRSAFRDAFLGKELAHPPSE